MSRPQTNLREFFTDVAFVDRLGREPDRAVDVIIPILHTNELWRANLLSIYREIPVKRLLLGDGGCIDNSIEIACNFPRVEVFDHRSFRSLGFSIRCLIDKVSTDWFVYLHSDVYLPRGWFDAMCAGQQKYDWFECGQNVAVMVEYLPPTLEVERAYSGSQMGRKTAFADVLPKIDDDYLYRNEDIIFANLIKNAGFRYGKVKETFHYHQLMFKESPWLRRVKRATFELELSREEEIRAARTYVMGIIKYLKPNEATDLIAGINENIERLRQLSALDRAAFACWVAETNAAWSAIYPIPNRLNPTKIYELSGRFEAGRDLSTQPNADGPSRAARTATYLLSAADLCLRGIVGPGRHIRARLQPHSSKLETIESRPTLAAMAAICKADRLLATEGLLRGGFIVLSKGCMQLSQSFERAANRVQPKGL